MSVDLSEKVARSRSGKLRVESKSTRRVIYSLPTMSSTYLPRLAKRGEKFDTIILDLPTFSRGNKGRKFQVERDMEALLMAALEVAEPKARILI